MDYIITLPSVVSVSIAPNPVSCRAEVRISVEVTEITKILYPEIIYSGELYAGEMEA